MSRTRLLAWLSVFFAIFLFGCEREGPVEEQPGQPPAEQVEPAEPIEPAPPPAEEPPPPGQQ